MIHASFNLFKLILSFIKTPSRVAVFLFLAIIGIFTTGSVALAAYARYAPGERVVIGEFVYEDDYTATSTNCYVSAYSPSRVLVINNALMATSSDGWHEYSTVPTEKGLWSANMSCGTAIGGDLISIDKSFLVGYFGASTTQIAAQVWNNSSRQLTTSLMTNGLSLATEDFLSSALDSASSSIITEILQNRSLMSSLNNISATDVWSYVGRDLDNPSILVASTSKAVWDRAIASLNGSGTIGKLIVDNLDVKISTRGTSTLTAADIWDATNRSLTDYSVATITTAVWNNAARTLTGSSSSLTAADVWNVLSSSLTATNTVGGLLVSNVDASMSSRASLSGQTANWNVRMSNVNSVAVSQTYRAKVYVFNSSAVATDSNSLPVVTVYDASRNLVVNAVNSTRLSQGVYEYTYSVPAAAAPGLWETIISTEVEVGKIIQTNDYWVVEASPAQVIINSITDLTVPSISANVTISNEGLNGYEYHYEWCVVSDASNVCGGSDDVYYASASKFINPGDDWNTNLTATVPSNGNYLFKLVVYFGTDHSGASRFFAATGEAQPPVVPPSTGGGGGGSPTPVVIPPKATTTPAVVCDGADFNHDKKVNSIDFSILLAFWKTDPPFRNVCVDINKDKKVNSVDFSILMYEWGKKK